MRPPPPALYKLPKTVKQLLKASATSDSLTPTRATVTGHIRSIRRQKHVTFALIEDGSSSAGLQAVFRHGPKGGVVRESILEKLNDLDFGASVTLTGMLVESKGPGQDFELVVDLGDSTVQGQSVEVVGKCDPSTYPLQPHHSDGGHSAEFLRDHLHLRLRTQPMQNVMRLRSKVKDALEGYLSKEQEFFNVHTPVLTGIDAEGGGETFRVAKTQKTEGQEGKEEFFAKPTYLTVSSQLHLEAYQAALGRVYTLAPCFRAERSMTGRHLAEFWMLECEWGNLGDIGIGSEIAKDLASNSSSRDLHGLCTFVEDMLRHTISAVLPDLGDHNPYKDELKQVENGPRWARVSYSDAVQILQQAEENHASTSSDLSSTSSSAGQKRLFEFPPALGASLQSEHEKYLAEVHFKGPLFVMDYPKELKPFYMRLNDDLEPDSDSSENRSIDKIRAGITTVACFDLLVPRVGELVGGSVREERFDVLKTRMEEAGLITASVPTSAPVSTSADAISGEGPEGLETKENSYEWYLDLRRHGPVPHGGFGMGFERLILWLGGAENVREALGMPRWKGRMGM
ncbi:hypothetical protein GYMLUDRAFT_42614 [Collybiopsis luxurians FD-317 M1]|uniref:Unplaced genomic scaffold GYMLUscaffold_22, whole genome shotgun sequence n=1 Tax=Collybiopsis luxurians FD-317 M1 TaxID=944289 RepID=A0A0D0C078_9AGAR|nr:hypothetical protein GYMLUDRAFT_42614 [Collybiopsis luxurians FD-317 M1]